jgi:hypothetical protein
MLGESIANAASPGPFKLVLSRGSLKHCSNNFLLNGVPTNQLSQFAVGCNNFEISICETFPEY